MPFCAGLLGAGSFWLFDCVAGDNETAADCGGFEGLADEVNPRWPALVVLKKFPDSIGDCGQISFPVCHKF